MAYIVTMSRPRKRLFCGGQISRMGGRHASERGRTVRSLIEPVQRLNEVVDIYVDIFREIE